MKGLRNLSKREVRGITIYEIKGSGEQVQIFKPYTIHNKIEIVVPDEKVDEVTEVILENAHTGLAGDGLIIVLPVDYKIRTKEKYT